MNFEFVGTEEITTIYNQYQNGPSLALSSELSSLFGIMGSKDTAIIHFHKRFPIVFIIDTIVHEVIHIVLEDIENEITSWLFDYSKADNICRLFELTREEKIEYINQRESD